TFRLRLPDTWKLHNAFHVQLLKPYKDPNQQFQGRQLPPPPPVLVQDEPEYEVERVLTHRRRGGKTLEFLLCWKGYDPTEDSWVVEADMGNARRALKDYLILTEGLLLLLTSSQVPRHCSTPCGWQTSRWLTNPSVTSTSCSRGVTGSCTRRSSSACTPATTTRHVTPTTSAASARTLTAPPATPTPSRNTSCGH
ncbi:unnamed protein product, partial [Closterium sp. NIES-54]